MMQTRSRHQKRIFEICIFAMLGSLMFCSKVIMELLPNIHLLGMLTMVYTLVFRVRALIPIYVYVLLNGLYAGFDIWWVPYLYIWAILWGVTMLLPQRMPPKVGAVVYPIVCALHGLAFGILYAPAQALFFGFDLQETIAWIMAGSAWDLLHMVGNFVAGLLILPMRRLLEKLVRRYGGI